MKVTLNLRQLLEDKKISQSEYDKFLKLAGQSTISLGINILVAFGVVSIGVAGAALVPSASTALLLSLIASALGFWIEMKYRLTWRLLGRILIVLGALGVAGSLFYLIGADDNMAYLVVLLVLLAAGIGARSALLMVLAVLSISPLIGMATYYGYASYVLIIERPIPTILTYTAVALGSFWLSKFLKKAEFENLALTASRAALFLGNFGFWVGSLWGDEFMKSIIAPELLAFLWAAAIVILGAWGVIRGRRFVVNLMAVFGAIHLYTQWYHYLGAEPLTLLLGGILAVLFGLGMWKYNEEALKA